MGRIYGGAWYPGLPPANLAPPLSSNSVTLIFDLLTSESMHAKVMSWSKCVLSLVLIAQVVLLLQHGHTDAHTATKSHHTQASASKQCTKHFVRGLSRSSLWSLWLLGTLKSLLTDYLSTCSVGPLLMRCDV